MKRKFKYGDHVYLKSKKDLAKILPREINRDLGDGDEVFLGYTNNADITGDNVVSAQDLILMRDKEYIVEECLPLGKEDKGVYYYGIRVVGSKPHSFDNIDDSLSVREEILCRPKEYQAYKSKRTLSTKFDLLHKLHGGKDE